MFLFASNFDFLINSVYRDSLKRNFYVSTASTFETSIIFFQKNKSLFEKETETKNEVCRMDYDIFPNTFRRM